LVTIAVAIYLNFENSVFTERLERTRDYTFSARDAQLLEDHKLISDALVRRHTLYFGGCTLCTRVGASANPTQMETP
jgi:hypothetical protein